MAQTPEQERLTKYYKLGRLRAMRDFLAQVRKDGGDIALVKMAHDMLLVEPRNDDAKWIFDQYSHKIPSAVQKATGGEIIFLKDGSILHKSIEVQRPVNHPCS